MPFDVPDLEFLRPANSLVWGFLGVMLFLAIVDFLTFWPSRVRHRDFKSSIVSLGILGTFVGVALGLWQFDSGDVEGSIPNLLEGLKTAFQTSILGMSIAVIVAVVERFIPRFSGDESKPEKQIFAELLEHAKKQRAELSGYIKGAKVDFTNIGESLKKLSEQLDQQRIDLRKDAKKTRKLIDGKFQSTNKMLDDALLKISEGASKEIIDALNKTISRFNEELTQQFGENFQQLNNACLNLVKWQEQHKESVEKTHEQLQHSVDALSGVEKTIAAISARNQEVLGVYEKLRDTIATYKNQTEALTLHLKKYGSLADKAEKMFGDADERFEGITNQITKFTEDMQKTVNAQSQVVTEITKQLGESLGNLESSLVGVTETMGKKYADFLAGAEHIAQMKPNTSNDRK